MALNDQLVAYDNKVYKLTVGQGTEKIYDTYYTGEDNVANDYISMLYYEVDTRGTYKGTFTVQRNQSNPTKKKVKISLNYRQYNITATEVPVGTITYTLPATGSRNDCKDALYDIFALPISPAAVGLPCKDTDVAIVTPGADTSDSGDGTGIIYLDVSSEYQLAMSYVLATKLGAGSQQGYIYDLQLLPYCPFMFNTDQIYYGPQGGNNYGPVFGKNCIDLTTLVSGDDYTYIYKNDIVQGQPVQTPVGIVFYPKQANFKTSIDYKVPDETVYYEWQEIKNPILLSQGREGDYTRYRFANFPYTVTDGTWDIGPNSNNQNVNVILSGDLTNEDCSYLSLQVSPSAAGGRRPALNIASAELPLQAANDYSTTITGDFTVKVLAHWVIPDGILEKKIKNECDFYRLSSPNYNSFYEFKKTKLWDGVDHMNVVCTYKPYNPFIKINPDLDNSLYSVKDYNDNIGLVLAGDYSIPMMSDAMVNYELSNRNYQAIFNRQIQNLDVNQRIQREQLDFQGGVGIATAGIAGSAAGLSVGMKTGNPYVAAGMAVAGGVAGHVLAGVGYANDKEWLQQQQYEARDFAIDNYKYQLGNIQALPQSMTKSTPLSYNNKVWPILEHFSCTEREKDVLREKIKYNGMTIMAIGKLIDYGANGGYLKGKMIRLLDLGDDSHIANAIYEEVEKGFYQGEE